MKNITLTLLLFCLFCTAKGQNIAGYEYWFDYQSDERVKVNSSNENITQNLDVSNLSEGIHFYNFRAKDSNGKWSAPVTQYFLRMKLNPTDNQLTQYEYWLDRDFENRQNVVSANGIINLNIDVALLYKGIHFFNFRAKDNRGNWSAPVTQYFYRADVNPVDNQLIQYEYWLDRDFENRQKVSSVNGIINLNIDVASLHKGIHFFNFRAKDNRGNWSAPVTQYFYIPESVSSDNKIIAYEYWCNRSDSAKTRMNITPINPLEWQNQLLEVNNLTSAATPENFEFVVDVYGNAKIYYNNANRFFIRFLDENGKWSEPSVSSFADGKGVDVVADTLYSDVSITKTKPNADEIHFYKLNALKGDSLIWKTNQPCTIQVFDPFGVEVYKASGNEMLTFGGVRAKRDGVYYVLLHSVNSYAQQITLDYKHIHKFAVLGYNPNKVGNIGFGMIAFEGNGFSETTRIQLRNVTDTITTDSIVAVDLGYIYPMFDFNNKTVGMYDIFVDFVDTVIVLQNAFEITPAVYGDITIDIIGSPSFRVGTVVPFTVKIKNNNNFQVESIPIWLAFSKDANVKFLFNVIAPYDPNDEDNNGTFLIFETDSLFNDFHNYKVYPLQIPYLLPNEERDLIIQLKSNNVIRMRTWIGEPYLDSEDTYTKSSTNNFGTACIPDFCEYMRQFECACGVATGLMKGIPNVMVAAAYQDKNLNNPAVRSQYETLKELGGDDLADEVFRVPPLESPGHLLGGALKNCSKNAAAQAAIKEYMDWQKEKYKDNNCTPNPPKRESTPIQSYDPNDKYGYRSPSGSTYFKEDVTNMTYVINFENDPEQATAAAQDVYITDTLDLSKFDINSFRAGYVRVGDKFKQAAYDVQDHTWDIDMRPEMNLITRVNLTLDKEKGIAKWHFISIDPTTDEHVTDVFAGFLPPDDETGRGQGSVSFTINLKDGLTNDAEISNRAEITFDYNEPIITPTWTNTKDIVPPVSQMLQPVELNDSIIRLSWEGTDNGSGVWHYTVYARSGDEGDWYVLNNNTEQTETQFEYEQKVKYGFYVEATDKAGNKEIKNPQTEVTFYKNNITEIKTEQNNLIKIYPNPSKSEIFIKSDFPIEKVEIYSFTGALLIQEHNFNEKISVSALSNGIYLLKVYTANGVVVSKIMKE